MVVESVLSLILNKRIVSSQVLFNWCQVRYRKAVPFREYRQPHLKQKLLLAACEPVFAIDRRPPAEKCGNFLFPFQPKPHHPYDVLLAKDMADEIESSGLVCLFHQNQMDSKSRRLLSNECQHAGMIFRFYNRDIAKICLENTPYEKLLKLSVGYLYPVLFAPDCTKINTIFKIVKKYSQVIMIGAMVERRRLIKVDQLRVISQMLDLDQQRAQLCQTLNAGQQSLLTNLNHHTSQLSQLLTTHAQPPSSD